MDYDDYMDAVRAQKRGDDGPMLALRYATYGEGMCQPERYHKMMRNLQDNKRRKRRKNGRRNNTHE